MNACTPFMNAAIGETWENMRMVNIFSNASPILALVFFILVFIFTIYSSMLGYHWFAYGTSVRASRLTLTVYLLGAAVLFHVMSIILYTY